MAKKPEPLQFELPLSEVGCKSLRAGGLDTAMIATAGVSPETDGPQAGHRNIPVRRARFRTHIIRFHLTQNYLLTY